MTDGPLFGDFPDRPDHPDFWKLSDVVLQHDGLTEDADFDIQAHLATVLDPDSLRYMLAARVKRSHDRSGAPALVQAQAAWLDGFMIGVAYARRHPVEETE